MSGLSSLHSVGCMPMHSVEFPMMPTHPLEGHLQAKIRSVVELTSLRKVSAKPLTAYLVGAYAE